MNLSINSIVFKADPKVLSKFTKLKDGTTINLEIISKAPKSYDLKCSSYVGDKFVGAYGEIVHNADRFEIRSKTFVDKMSKTADEGLVKEIKEFFTSISK